MVQSAPVRSLIRSYILPSLIALGGATLAGCDDEVPVPSADTRPRGPTVARAAITIGEVEVRRASSEQWLALTAGTELERGDLIRTGKGSFVSVKFKTGGGFELEENGLMIIRVAEVPGAADANAPATQQTVVALQSGVARGVFAEDEALLAPLVIEEDDGTRVSLAPSSNREATSIRLSKTARGTEVAVSQGTAVLTTGGKRISLSRGQAADVRKAGGLSEVVELLDYPPSVAPGIDARFQFAAGLSIPVSWKPVSGAAGYRLQVAKDLGFQTIVTNVDLEATETQFRPIEAGTYAWRVAARDAQGRVGEFGFARRIFAERDAPVDLLVAPEDGASYAYDAQTPPPVLFAWQSAANATQYRLVIAKTADLLDGPVVDRALAEQRAEVATLEPGEYWWGVYLAGGQAVPVFTSPRKLVVVKSSKATFQTPKSISTWGKKRQ